MTDRPVIILENRPVFVNPEQVEAHKLQAARYGTLLKAASTPRVQAALAAACWKSRR